MNGCPEDCARGVYTLANDVVLEWFEAFVRSLRKTNPHLPLMVIPYNTAVSQLKILAAVYDFTIMGEAECSHFDTLEGVVMGKGRSVPMFRKWATFFGPYREFIFLDADTVVLTDLNEILEAYSASSSDLVYFDTSLSMAYTDEAIPEMVREYGAVGFNAGAFASRKGVIDYEEIIAISHRAAADRGKLFMAFDVGDQPFMNYVFDTSRRRTESISALLPKFAAASTVRQPLSYNPRTATALDGDGKVMPFLHWPGCAFPTMLRPRIFLQFRMEGMSIPARVTYQGGFYLRRLVAALLRVKARVTPVLFKFCRDKAWRKYYLCKLVGMKVAAPAEQGG